MKGTNSLDMDMKGVKDVFGQAMELPFPEASRGRQGFLGMFRLNFQAEMSRRQLNALIWNQGRELVWGNISKKKKKKKKTEILSLPTISKRFLFLEYHYFLWLLKPTLFQEANKIFGFLGGSVVKNPPANAGDTSLIPQVGKIHWKRKWQPTPVFLPGKSRGHSSLVGYRAFLNSDLHCGRSSGIWYRNDRGQDVTI